MSATPGPWKVCDDPPNATWFRGRTISAANPDDARRVCDVFCFLTPPPANSMEEANARLIAAAPELLAQAKAAADTFADLAQTFTVFGYPVAADACRVAERSTRASVAKAEGK